MRDVVDVQPPGGNVRSHQDLEVSPPEAVHGLVTLRLREVAVQFADREAVAGNRSLQTPRRLLGPGKDEDRRHLRMAQQVP